GESHLEISEEPFEIGRTYRVTGQWTNDKVLLWIDGQSVRMRRQEYQLYPSRLSLCFGGLASGLLPRDQGVRYFSGRIHRLSLHQGELPTNNDRLLTEFELAPSTVLAFNLDQGSGQTVTSEDDRYRAKLFNCQWIHD
ncbi:unnamed protein product, partial [Hapterophycus canaliculatus]